MALMGRTCPFVWGLGDSHGKGMVFVRMMHSGQDNKQYG